MLKNLLRLWFCCASGLAVLWILNIISLSGLLMLVLSPFIVCSAVLPETKRRAVLDFDRREQWDERRCGPFDYMNPLYAETRSPESQCDLKDDRLTSSMSIGADHAMHTDIIVFDRNSDYSISTSNSGTISSGLNNW
jgi:hypothetical protein